MSKQENSKSYFLTKTIFTKNESKELSAFGTGTFSKEIVQRFFTGEKTRYTSFILRTVQYRPKKRLIFIWISSATQWSLLSQSFKIWSRDQELSSEVFIIMMTSSVTSQLKPQGYEGFQTFFGISAYARPPTTLKVVPKCSPHHSASSYIWLGENVDFLPKNSRSGQCLSWSASSQWIFQLRLKFLMIYLNCFLAQACEHPSFLVFLCRCIFLKLF